MNPRRKRKDGRARVYSNTRAYKIRQVIDWTCAYCKSGYVFSIHLNIFAVCHAIWVSGSHNHISFACSRLNFSIKRTMRFLEEHTFAIFVERNQRGLPSDGHVITCNILIPFRFTSRPFPLPSVSGGFVPDDWIGTCPWKRNEQGRN